MIHTYGFLLALAFVLGLWASGKAAQREGIEKSKAYDLGLYIAISSLVGSKLLLFITELNYYVQNPGEIFSLTTLRSGGVYYGGFILAVITGLTLSRRQHLPIWKMADIFTPGIALGQSIGRLGCFAAGCCYGKPTSLPFAVTFKNPYSHETVGVPILTPLHPTQLYESLASLIIFGILWRRLQHKHFDGQVFISYLALYSITRFLIEFLRGDPERGFVLNGLLSTSQFISVLMISLAVFLFFTLKRAAQPKPA